MTVQEIRAAALALDATDRVELADALYASLPVDPEIQKEWAAEIERRITEIEAGKAEAIPLEEVFGHGRRIINESRSFSTLSKG